MSLNFNFIKLNFRVVNLNANIVNVNNKSYIKMLHRQFIEQSGKVEFLSLTL